MDYEMDKTLEAGFNAIISKPLNVCELFKLIRKHLDYLLSLAFISGTVNNTEACFSSGIPGPVSSTQNSMKSDPAL